MNNSKPFLEMVAERVSLLSGDDPAQFCVVFPNRRAGLFFRKHLATCIGKPFFSPEVLSVDDFITQLSGHMYADSVALISCLYEVHLEKEGDSAQSFREFLGWGGTLLSDFNEVDKQLADARKLFGYLNESKAIEMWDPSGKALTTFEKNYLRFYNSLSDYYTLFTQKLRETKTVYPGLAARILAETDTSELLQKVSWKRIIFAGFNALSVAEKRIIDVLTEEDRAEVIFDADSYYLDDPKQEAGLFLRSYRQNSNYRIAVTEPSRFAAPTKEIVIAGVAGKAGQTKAAAIFLNTLMREGGSPGDTAVILNDGSLLLPLLHSIPPEAGNFNVTMGYPLRYTPVYQLISVLFDLHENAARYAATHTGNVYRFYSRDLIRLLLNSYTSAMFGGSFSEPATIVHLIKNSNRAYMAADEFIHLLSGQGLESPPSFLLMLKPWKNDPSAALLNIREVMQAIRQLCTVQKEDEGDEQEPLTSAALMLEYLYHFHLLLNTMENTPDLISRLDSTATFRSLLNQIVRSSHIPFYGEPLQGLQVMGMLEAQALDFKNVIMLSVNDDLLPSGRLPHSFIPTELKREFNLTDYQERDAIYAYHFYRLLQRSERVFLVYNTEPGNLGGGEPSRFISQLLYELPFFNAGIKITGKSFASLPETGIADHAVSIPVTPAVRKKLDQVAAGGLSASACISFLNCPLQFCLRYVYGIEEAAGVEESIESATLGSAIHAVLFNLYAPYRNMVLTREDVSAMKKRITPELTSAFSEIYTGGNIESGKNFLFFKVAERMVSNFLDTEIHFLQEGNELMVLALEEKMECRVTLEPEKREVKLKGIADRIDATGGTVRLIDYKTGRVDPKTLRISDWDDLLKLESRIAFQLSYYSYLYHKMTGTPVNTVKAGVIGFRSLSSGLITLQLPDHEAGQDDSYVVFENMLHRLVADIFSDAPFQQTDNPDACRFCPFTDLCSR